MTSVVISSDLLSAVEDSAHHTYLNNGVIHIVRVSSPKWNVNFFIVLMTISLRSFPALVHTLRSRSTAIFFFLTCHDIMNFY